MKYEVKVQYVLIDDATGKEKKKSEAILVGAASFGDAENQAYSIYDGYNEFAVKSITISKVTAVAFSEEVKDSHFKCTIEYGITDDNGKLKVYKEEILVAANTNDDASFNLKHFLKDMSFEYEIKKVAYSQIVAVENIE